MTRTTLWLAPVCLLLVSGTLHSQSKSEVTTLTLQLKERNREFNDALRGAKQGALDEFQKMIRTVRNNPKLSATVKADKVNELKQAKKEFEESGTFPKDPEYLLVQLKYFRNISKSYKPLSKVYNQLMNIALKNDDEALQKNLKGQRKTLDQQVPGVAAFVAGSKWNGTLYFNNSGTATYHVRVGKLNGSIFKGYAIDNAVFAGHPEYEVEGNIDGLEVKFALTKVVQGGVKAAEFKGILAGERVVGEWIQADARGKRNPGFVILNLAK
jgi:hypothetical protein